MYDGDFGLSKFGTGFNLLLRWVHEIKFTEIGTSQLARMMATVKAEITNWDPKVKNFAPEKE